MVPLRRSDVHAPAFDAQEVLGEESDGFWVDDFFPLPDAFGESFRGVFFVDRERLLEDDRAAVVNVVHKMHAAAGDIASGFEHGLMDAPAIEALAAEAGQQGGVNVHHSAFEVRRDDPHRQEAAHADKIHVSLAQSAGDLLTEQTFRMARSFDNRRGDIGVGRPLQALGARPGADDELEVNIQFTALAQIDEVLQGRAAAGNEHSDTER